MLILLDSWKWATVLWCFSYFYSQVDLQRWSPRILYHFNVVLYFLERLSIYRHLVDFEACLKPYLPVRKPWATMPRKKRARKKRIPGPVQSFCWFKHGNHGKSRPATWVLSRVLLNRNSKGRLNTSTLLWKKEFKLDKCGLCCAS